MGYAPPWMSFTWDSEHSKVDVAIKLSWLGHRITRSFIVSMNELQCIEVESHCFMAWMKIFYGLKMMIMRS